MNGRDLTPEQQAMVEVWERHTAAEFTEKSIDATMATMTSDPFVNHVPVMTGGVGSSEVRHFYGTYFLQVTHRTPKSSRSLAHWEKTASSMN
jgi:carboxymethylenebutenolidase